MINKTIVEYEDGSEFTVGHFLTALTAGAIIAVGHGVIKDRLHKKKNRKFHDMIAENNRKTQEAFDRS